METLQSDFREIQADAIGQLFGVAKNHTLVVKLLGRKINVDACMIFNVRPHGYGWAYDTPRGATRWKNADPSGDKYAWLGDKRDTLLYFPDDISQAVQMAEGNCWLVTEFDVLALRSAGVLNTVGQIGGESSTPKQDLIDLFYSLGVTVCHVAPDLDKVGAKWAQKITDLLTPAGIEVIAHKLPAALGEGGDVGKAWQIHNGTNFERYLLNLPNYRLDPTKQESETKEKTKSRADTNLKQAVLFHFGITHFNKKGYSKNVICPFHNGGAEKRPSAAIHKDNGLRCFVCGQIGWKRTAEQLGLYVLPAARIPDPTPARPTLAYETISAMIANGYDVMAWIISRVYAEGWEPGRVFVKQDLLNLGINRRRVDRFADQVSGKSKAKRKTLERARRSERPWGVSFSPFLSLCFLYIL
ncbi:MAG: hypothetical protein HYZ25_19185 [Chloroflexi bacterium]|nr:hypothetical protein [Chloroflexota bacterium]